MNKKSGTAGTAVEPAAPIAAHEADVADPGEVEKVKAEQAKTQSGKYGAEKVKPFKADNDDAAGSDEEKKDEETKSSWIEIALVGEDDKPIPGEKYRITLPDNSVDEGTLDQNGWVRVEGFQKGDCKITFPELDQAAWEYVDSGGSKKAES